MANKLDPKVDAFMRHPTVQSVSAAFCCGIIGFALGALVCALIYPSPLAVKITGSGAASLFAFLGVRSALYATDAPRRKANLSILPGTAAGATLIIGSALSVLGLSGMWLLFGAVVTGLLVACLLSTLRY